LKKDPELSPTCETDTLDYALISPFDEHHVVRMPSAINNTPLSKNRTAFHLAASPSTSSSSATTTPPKKRVWLFDDTPSTKSSVSAYVPSSSDDEKEI
jgi:hypothetical protein